MTEFFTIYANLLQAYGFPAMSPNSSRSVKTPTLNRVARGAVVCGYVESGAGEGSDEQVSLLSSFFSFSLYEKPPCKWLTRCPRN